MKEPSYGLAAQLAAGTPNPATIGDLPVAGLLVTATVAGTAQVVLAGGATVPVAYPVGTIVLQLAAIEVSSSTATATYYQLA